MARCYQNRLPIGPKIIAVPGPRGEANFDEICNTVCFKSRPNSGGKQIFSILYSHIRTISLYPCNTLAGIIVVINGPVYRSIIDYSEPLDFSFHTRCSM